MISPKLQDSQWSDWSAPPPPPPDPSQFTQSLNRTTQNNSHISNTLSVNAIQHHSKVQPQTKSNNSCKPLQWWSSLSPVVRGMVLGVLPGCLILVIILPIWLVKPSTRTTLAPVNTPPLRWNTTAITIVGTTGVMGIAANQLSSPWDLVLDWSNTLYVTDRYNHRVQKFLRNVENGTTIAGQMNGTSGAASNQLNQPTGIYVDSNGNMFISDANNNRIQYWLNGTVSGETLIGNGTIGITNNLLFFPYGIWCNENAGILYVADSYNQRMMSYNNNAPPGNIAAGGNGFGTATSQLSFPYGFYFDSLSNSLLITNAGTHSIVRWMIGATNWTLVAGNNGVSGTAATYFNSPTDVTLDPMGNMYVVDMGNQRIQFFSSGQSSGVTIAGITNVVGNNSTLLNYPSSLTFDNQLNLYVVDQGNHRIQKFLRY